MTRPADDALGVLVMGLLIVFVGCRREVAAVAAFAAGFAAACALGSYLGGGW